MDYYRKHPSTSWYPKAEGMFFKTTPNCYNKIYSNESYSNSKIFNEYDEYKYLYMGAYLTHSTKYEDYSGCRDGIRGWFIDRKKWNEMLNELGEDKKLYDEKYWSNDVDLSPNNTEKLTAKREMPKEEHRIPVFRFTTMQGNTFEVKNATREEIKVKLAERFPKWSEEALERALNNKKYYPMGENRMNLKEDIDSMQYHHGDNMRMVYNEKNNTVTIRME